ncbi:outer membrane beta-barrel protein [uncultured Kordia sp.]|uniref:outer membrane beta-barrel protein n=1 Tax=uncultured Kordia sp. TaxID=507699 RepID=UPI0026220F68|nr:outer membrane beta-barrel protein [uncultured Kordia sp.]
MKKIVLFLCLFIIGYAHAQDNTSDQDESNNTLLFAKGSNLINTSFFINSSTTDNMSVTVTEEKVFVAGINASYAYAVSDNFFIGLGVGYEHRDRDVKLTFDDDQEVKINTFNIFPYVRYYKGIGKRLAIFGQGEVLYSHRQAKTNGENNIRTKALFVGIRPGFTYMFSKNIGLEINIGAVGYTSSEIYNPTNDTTTDISEFRASLNFEDLIFGLSYYF